MTEYKCPERRTARDIARERADAAIARIEQTTTLTEHMKKFIVAHELEHARYERNAYNEACDNAINVQLSDRAEFLTDFDKPYEPAQPVHLPRYVKKGRDARPSRNPFADNSVRKQKR